MTGFSPSPWYQYIDGSNKIILVQCDFHSSSDCHPSWKLKTESEYKQKPKKKLLCKLIVILQLVISVTDCKLFNKIKEQNNDNNESLNNSLVEVPYWK